MSPRPFRFLILLATLVILFAPVPASDDKVSREFTLHLSEFSFDPLVGLPVLPPGWDQSAQMTPDLHLVQFDGPIPGDAFPRLRRAGLEPVTYIYPNTYVVWGRRADRDGLAGQPSIRWTGDFAPAFRVMPQLRIPGEGTVDVDLLISRRADADRVIGDLQRLGLQSITRRDAGSAFEILSARMPLERIQASASVAGVFSIQPQPGSWFSRAEVSAQINAGNVNGSNLAFPGYQGWLTGLGIDGAGVTVAVVDEGIDSSHPDLLASLAPCIGESCGVGATSPHGTHVAGIVTGDGTTAVLDANGFLRGQGVAPGASFFGQHYGLFQSAADGPRALMTDSSHNGALVSNNSWGISRSAKGYNAQTLLVDAGVRDAEPNAPGLQPLIYVQAIENGDGGSSSHGVPDEAKNIIAVGSTWALDPSFNPRGDINSLSDNSAHGPALDGRTLPHIVAPGCLVDSTYPDVGEGYEHHRVCGTSMAAPQISGAIALFIEAYRSLFGAGVAPSPALVKAALLPVAHDLSGGEDADGLTLGHRPDSKQGWGRLNLTALVDPPADSTIYYDQIRVFEESGEQWSRQVEPVDSGLPMRIMLTWTDAPGHGLGGTTPAWNNDLDLVVEADGATYLGNVFGSNGFSATGGSADPRNNAEGVFLELPPSEVTLRVLASNINSDGVPGVTDETDQDFALVCYNCRYLPGFALTPDPVTESICAPSLAGYGIDVEGLSSYSEEVTLSVSGVPAGATASFDLNPVSPGGSARLTIDPGTALTGDYDLDLQGDSVDQVQNHPLYLRLRTAVPVAVGLTLPVDEAVEIFPQPLLEWNAVSWASHYVVQLSTDPTFDSLFYSGFSKGPSHQVEEILDQQTVYYWRVRAANVCGVGEFSSAFSFTTQNVSDVLLVDDDWDFYGDFQQDYKDALDALPLEPHNYPVTYDVWDVNGVENRLEPEYSTLAHYDKVVWYSGREEIYAGPTEESEAELLKWFKLQTGCFLITSADYIVNRGGLSPFMQQELGVASANQETGQGEVTGSGSVFGVLGPTPIPLSSINPDFSDSLTPDATAEVAFSGDLGPAGVNKDGGYYRTAFLGYGMERMNTSLDLENTLREFFEWCDAIPAGDGDLDGVDNASDCAPGDADAWTVPSPVEDLQVHSGQPVEFSWSQPTSGGSSVYDLLRSPDPSDFWSATCVRSGIEETAVDQGWDLDPAPGQAFYYQVRTRGPCGSSNLGSNPDGSPRYGAACQ